MAQLIYIACDRLEEREGGGIVVSRDSSGSSFGWSNVSLGSIPEPALLHPYLQNTIKAAVAHADQYGIPTIYVVKE